MEDENVTCLIKKLQSEISSVDERKEIYHHISSHLKEDDLSLFTIDLASNSKILWPILQSDLKQSNVEITQQVLQVLGFCLNESDSVNHLSPEDCRSAVVTLCQCIQQTEDKITCTRALWCLHKQNIALDVVRKEIQNILGAVEYAFTQWKSQSTVENEASHVIYRLLQQCPKDTRQQVVRWAKLILPLLVHGAVKIREKAVEVIQSELSTLMCNQKDLGGWLSSEFKTKFSPEMRKLLNTHYLYVLQIWEIFVQISGQELHHGSFINSLLPFVEHGFKNPETRIQAFQAWQHLINNFATNPDILTDPRRVKLIMQVLKVHNAKKEDVASAKLQVWWHFVWLLGSKVSTYFEQVCVPLLNFCLGGARGPVNTQSNTPRVLQNGTSPMTPRLNLPGSGGQTKSHLPQFQSLQLKGCEILVHFFGEVPKDLDLPQYNFTLDPLNYEIITGQAFFLKHANFLIVTTIELICSLGDHIPEQLLCRLWYSLIAHLKNGLDNSVKGEVRDAFTTFLTHFQVLVLSTALSPMAVLKLFQAVCCLPRKALCSTAYNVSNGEKMHGTPALFLTELLLTPSLLKPCCNVESFIVLFRNLVSIGVKSTGTLEFCQSVMQLLERNGEFVSSPETLWRLWSELVNPLHDHINQTNEVNQGDALEHNFGCLYAVLVFPLSQKLPSNMPQTSVKTLLKTWTEIYSSFARLSALVTNAEANICCEDLCQALLKVTDKENLQCAVSLDFHFHCLHAIISSFDFSSLGNAGSFNIGGVSPAKWKKAKQKPMDKLQSFTMLLHLLVTHLVEELSDTEKSPGMSLQGAANNVVEIVTMMVTHTSASNILSNVIGHLAEPLGNLYQAGAKKLSSKILNNAYLQKLEKLWSDICSNLLTKYKGQYDSEFLQRVCPLLEATFLHPRRTIKNQTTSFWTATFSKTTHLLYPEKIKPVLMKVKGKTPITLPGWISTEISIIEETPVSQMSQAESQAPEPHIPGMPSPHKIHGSFLNKAVSPNVKKSPAKKVDSKPTAVAKKDLMVNGLSNEDFVVIKSPLKKKRVLTEHQKEVFREKRALPAMYNSLDASQDVSMMSQFSSDTQQDTPTFTTDLNPIVINSSQSQSLLDVDPKKLRTQDGEKQPQDDREKKGSKSRRTSSNSSDKMEEGKTPTRRSVRFSLDNEEKKKDLTSSQEDFNKIWDTCLSPDREQTDVTKIKEKTKDLDSEKDKFSMIISATIENDRNSGEVVSSNSKSCSSSTLEEIPQNQLEGGYMDTSPRSSSEKESTCKSTLSEKDVQDPSNSQPLQSWTKQLQELSQSSPARSGSLKGLTSQGRSPSPRRAKSPRKVMSPKGKLEVPTKGNLDNWLIKSPDKLSSSQENDSDNIIPSSQSSVASLVEETQSPSKFVKGKLSQEMTGNGENLHPILETPPRPNHALSENSNSSSVGLKGSSRKLFPKSDSQDIEMVEDSNMVPASPSGRVIGQVQVSTPVIKIKRLTQEEILSYSPSRKSSLEEVTKVTKGNTHSENSNDAVHEHDDFSDLKPLEDTTSSQTDDLPASQDLNVMLQKAEQVEALSSQGFETNNSGFDVTNKTKPRRILEDKDTCTPIAKSVLSENLFTPVHFEKDSEAYDPEVNSTFKSEKNVQVIGTDNLKSSQSSEESKSSQEIQAVESTAGTYNPDLQSTLAVETPRRGRKRKQEAPKQLTPESTRPKRMRKSKGNSSQENSSQESSEISQDETNNKASNSGKLTRRNLRNNNSEIVCGEDQVVKDSRKGESVSDREKKIEMQSKDLARGEIIVEKDGSLQTSALGDMVKGTLDDKQMLVEAEKNTSLVSSNLTTNDQSSCHEKITESNISNDARQGMTCKMLEIKYRGESLKSMPKEDVKRNSQDSLPTVGEKTPESRTQSKPERQSTAKKKKEVVLKRAQRSRKGRRIGKDIQGSNESDSSADDEPLLKADKSAEQEVTESKINGEENKEKEDTEKDSSFEKDKENKEGLVNVSDVSSNDDIPLSRIVETKRVKENDKDKNDIKSNNTGETGSKSDEKTASPPKNVAGRRRMKLTSGKTSPLSNRLRSSGKVLRTRGCKVSFDKNLMKPVSSRFKKALKTKSVDASSEVSAMENQNVELESEVKKSENVSDINRENNIDSSDVSQGIKQSKEVSDKNQESSNVSETENEVDEPQEDSVPEGCEGGGVVKHSVTFSEDMMEDTPRKTPDVKSTRGAFGMQECSSDSKLVTVPRKFQKRLARRSILKQQSNVELQKSPPLNKHFHPIKVGHVYSPAASPSASILKRRRLLGNSPSNSPSPSSKQRRVSFAEPLTEEQELEKIVSSKEDDASLKSQAICPSLPEKTSVKFSTSQSKSSVPNVSESTQSQEVDTPMSASLGSYHSTVESDLNTTDPIYPELVECSQSVEKVLSQLTSSLWTRGLGQLVRSRNILTIGDLSSMTEREIQALPIRSPKVSTVRKVLKNYVGQREGKKSKLATSNTSDQIKVADTEESTTPPGTPGAARRVEKESDEMEIAPPMELDMSCCSPIKRNPNEDLNTSVRDVLSEAGDLLEEVNRLTCDVGNGQSHGSLLTNQSTPKSLFGQSNLRLQVTQSSTKTVSNVLGNQKNSMEDYAADSEGSEFVSLPSDKNLMGTPSSSSRSIVDRLQEVIGRCSPECLSQVQTEDLFELHRMSTSLTNQVMAALKTRCQSANTES